MKRSVMLGVCAFVAPFWVGVQVASAGRSQTVAEPESAAAGCPTPSPISAEMIQNQHRQRCVWTFWGLTRSAVPLRFLTQKSR